MADPLSVAASIIGILGAAAKITETVQPLISNTRNAPKLALQVYREVNSVRMVLASLETVLKDLGTPSAQTTARHIQVDYVVVLLTDGVLLFSELDALLAPLKAPDTGQSNPQMPLRQRALWATKKGDISVIIGQMQNFFAALSAMFNMFHWYVTLAYTVDIANDHQPVGDGYYDIANKARGYSHRVTSQERCACRQSAAPGERPSERRPDLNVE
jgi:hypothetical protein